MASGRVGKTLLVAAAKNGQAIHCDVDATKFLLSYPRGAYTGARTVQQTKIFDYDGHIKRLVESTIAMQQDAKTLSWDEVEAALRPRTEATLRAAMDNFKQQYGSDEHEEYKITVLVCEDETADTASAASFLGATNVLCHIGLLPPLRSNLVKLQVAGMPRQNASAKDSAWVRERKVIYDAMPKDVEEIILMEPDSHHLLEGSQTNFYTFQQGKIYTAEEGILKGTVRSLVLDVCKKEGIPVVLEPPTLEAVDSWDACFISSTSRLVLGAGSIEYDHPASKTRQVRTFERSAVLDRISDAVRASVLTRSSDVF
ncbi:hypothetical protein Poli38472_006027 [Pythium oligandrum]|uniref:Uncharacterized protein n=1 Tax=Pythium oligandrum TaxID=41045 RepID=A0A8K1CS40_PYTOL|nr:hypothetical protein Poli38472_006027 [Pythium oligandrum]|eukprot:TMW68559.1 hypothetical protein Poli38472_006027 [Pythium oligandrum]